MSSLRRRVLGLRWSLHFRSFKQPSRWLVRFDLRNVTDLIALAKGKPGQLNYASMGVGSSPHLGAELFKSLAHVDITHMPYKGSADSITAPLAGNVSVFFVGESTAAPHVTAGRLRALGTTGRKRSVIFPDVSTITDSGLHGFELGIWFGILVPAATHNDLVRKLHADFTRILENRDLRDALAGRGFETQSSTPEEFRALMQKDQDLWAALIEDLGIKRQWAGAQSAGADLAESIRFAPCRAWVIADSGRACATRSAATMPFVPGWFSTIRMRGLD